MKEFDINTHRIRAVFMWAVSRNDRGGSDRPNAIDITFMIHLQLKKSSALFFLMRINHLC